MAFNTKNKSWAFAVNFSLWSAWLALVFAVTLRHELFRDEVRALSIVSRLHSPLEIITAIKGEGHPGLWYLILYAGLGLAHSKFILQGASFLIAGIAVALFLFKSPFSLLIKALFILGLPIYEYSVMARNYGVSMALFFAYACAYPGRRNNPLLPGLLLALLANTNLNALIMACLLSALWIWDELASENAGAPQQRLKAFGAGVFPALMGILLAIHTVWPASSGQPPVDFGAQGKFSMPAATTQIPVNTHSAGEILSTLASNLAFPGKRFSAILPIGYENIFNSVLVWGLVLGLANRRRLSIGLLAGFALVGTLGDLYYLLYTRHQGVVWMYALCLYWLALDEKPTPDQEINKASWRARIPLLAATTLIIPLILGFQAYKECREGLWDWNGGERSSTARLGRFLYIHRELNDAILIGEPDFLIESLPFYAPNRIYVPRISAYNAISGGEGTLSFEELLQQARELRKSEKKPVLIALSLDYLKLDGRKAREIKAPINKVFNWTEEGLAGFQAATTVLAEFRDALDENYALFQLKDW